MSRPGGIWSLIVHGGAKEIGSGDEQANRDGLAEALDAGRRVLESGGSAVDACEASVRVLERLAVFNAGYGSVLNAAGDVEMCSGFMDGATLDVGAVGAVKGVLHPVSIARAMLRETPVLLVGEGAALFAREKGAEMASPDALITRKALEDLCAEHDTVGAVALDRDGNLAAATSTGGLTGAAVGRMGDSALPGCGYYADNRLGAVAFSGHGEGIARLVLAAQVMASIGRDGPEAAIARAVGQMPRVGGDAGGIGMSPDGSSGWAHNSRHFAVAAARSSQPDGRVRLRKDEDR